VKYILDTNVLSEIRKPQGNAKVKAFVNNLKEEDIFISVISIGEITYGLEKLPPGPNKTDLSIWVSQKLTERCGSRIVPLDADIMAEWGRLQARTAKTLPLFDSLIAATALARRLTVVTRNTKDFEKIKGLVLLDPWKEEQSYT
jgi:predicted nucleic acid-binding protein